MPLVPVLLPAQLHEPALLSCREATEGQVDAPTGAVQRAHRVLVRPPFHLLHFGLGGLILQYFTDCDPRGSSFRQHGRHLRQPDSLRVEKV